MPPKLTFRAGQVFHPEYLVRNKVTNLRLGLPVFGEARGTKSKLAVVGGGPEVVRFRDDLRAWDGEIWAINGAFGWCLDNGIPATFFSLDASDALLGMAQRATAAILADHCNPSVVAAASGPVQMIDLEHTPLGATSAASVPMLAAINGNPSVTLFGCESSFTDREHAYSWSLVTESRVLVECGGQEYLTTPQLIMQAEYLADIARRVPGYVTVKGSGFLPALIEHGDYEVVKVSRDIAQASGGAP